MIELCQITKRREAAGLVLDAVSLRILSGEITALIGANGSGKSTLAKVLAGIEEQDSGMVVGILPTEVGLVPQDYRATLLPWLSVLDNIAFPLKIRGFSGRERSYKLQRLIAEVPVAELLDRRVWELSGGQAQLVCIARALIAEPKLLILDEPFSALDIVLSLELGELLQDIVSSRDIAILLITHNIDHALDLAGSWHILGARPGRVITSRSRAETQADRSLNRKTTSIHEIIQIIASNQAKAA